MTNINSVVVTGNLVKDAELKSVGQSKVINFTIAVNESVKNGDSWEDRANFLDCSFFGKLAEKLAPYLVKGKKVMVQGVLHQDRWKDSNGNNKQKIIIRANSVELGSSPTQQSNVKEANGNSAENFKEDIPF